MFCSLADEAASCFPGDDQLSHAWVGSEGCSVGGTGGSFCATGMLPGYSPRWPCAQLFLWQPWSKCNDDKILRVLFFPTHYLFSAVAKSFIPTAGWELVDVKDYTPQTQPSYVEYEVHECKGIGNLDQFSLLLEAFCNAVSNGRSPHREAHSKDCT